LLGVERSRIRVIHHGVRPPAVDPAPDSQRRNMILHIGAIQTRKNLSRLVDAFEQTPAGWKLVLAGSLGYGAEAILTQVSKSARSSDIELPGYVTDEQRESLYAQARVFAFPSLDEGFGMPVLEAMVRGIPVITSNRSALSEVAGDAALLIDPLSVESLTAGLRQMAEDSDLRERYRARGLVRAADFSWERTISKTWAVYGELLKAV
jgi:glycosyltransferase involved in cell wall biosynthesis